MRTRMSDLLYFSVMRQASLISGVEMLRHLASNSYAPRRDIDCASGSPPLFFSHFDRSSFTILRMVIMDNESAELAPEIRRKPRLSLRCLKNARFLSLREALLAGNA